MIRRPPRSTLFPYTDALPIYFDGGAVRTDAVGHALGLEAVDQHARILGVELGIEGPVFGAAGPDRKSTRLNSSHSSISYAVFCLKKKKKKNVSTLIALL